MKKINFNFIIMIYMWVIFPSNVNAQEETNNMLKIKAAPSFFINYSQDFKKTYFPVTTNFLLGNIIDVVGSINSNNPDTSLINRHIVDFIPTSNISAGIGLDFTISTSAVLTIGLGYKSTGYKINESRTSTATVIAPGDPLIFEGSFVPQFSSSVSSFRTENLTIPITVRSKISKKFALNGSFVSNFLIKGVSTQNKSFFDQPIATGKLSSNHLFKPNVFEVAAGLSYSISKLITIDIQYKSAITNQISDTSSSWFFGVDTHKPSSIGLTISSALSTIKSTQDSNIKGSKTRKSD